MKRFTFTSDDYWAVDNQNCFEDQSEDYCGPAIDRLAAYEDTGLLPQEVSAKVKWADSAAKALANIFGNVGVFDLSKLNDLKKSAEQIWIPVTERLPEDDLPKYSKAKQIKVLTASKSDNGVITVRSQMRFRMTWYKSAPWAWKSSGSEVTHWMPMPEPPKGD